MEELFGDPAYKGFVLQDKKRLPARFFARISGALTSRLRLGLTAPARPDSSRHSLSTSTDLRT